MPCSDQLRKKRYEQWGQQQDGHGCTACKQSRSVQDIKEPECGCDKAAWLSRGVKAYRCRADEEKARALRLLDGRNGGTTKVTSRTC